jgi:ribonuclease J
MTRRGHLLGEAQVALDGVPTQNDEGEPMIDLALDAVDGCLVSIPPARRKDGAMVSEAVRRSVRSAISQAWGKKPIVKVLLNVVDTR